MIKTINWELKKSTAKTKTKAELIFAINDCIEAGNAMIENEGYYMDEASIYRSELRTR